MKLDSLKKLYVHQLKDLYSAERQVLEALPEMAAKADDQELSRAFENHAKQTKTHIQRLESIFKSLDFEPGGEHCDGAEGLIKETKGMLQQDIEPAVLDAGLIAAAQRFEHYEMAGYGSACAFARKLGEHGAADLLTQTLDEESDTNNALTRLAERKLNFEAMNLGR